ncbi:MAG: mandelate racemase/muconate lactonizing enzyme family protein [Candidatus Methylomirabilales bacterium]
MKITGVQAYALRGLLKDGGFGWSLRVTDRRESAICVIETDTGLQGVGEALYIGPARLVAQVIGELFGPLLLGQDPLETSVLWDRMYDLSRDGGQKGLPIAAISALDIALWDLKGKALGLPVYTLLGGAYRRRARVYATGLYEPQQVPDVEQALVAEALGYKAAGFPGMKLKVGYGVERDTALVRAIRRAIGDDLALMIDANHAYSAPEALRLARAIGPERIYWFEEPVPPEDLDGYVELRRSAGIPIAGGECEYTRYGFRELINRRAVDILQPDLGAAGGFSELQKILAMASAANLPVMPHVWGTNVGLAAALQLFAALPHFPERRFPAEPFFELDQSPHPFRCRTTREQFPMRDGYVAIPDRPGLGITLDLDGVRAHGV